MFSSLKSCRKTNYEDHPIGPTGLQVNLKYLLAGLCKKSLLNSNVVLTLRYMPLPNRRGVMPFSRKRKMDPRKAQNLLKLSSSTELKIKLMPLESQSWPKVKGIEAELSAKLYLYISFNSLNTHTHSLSHEYHYSHGPDEKLSGPELNYLAPKC